MEGVFKFGREVFDFIDGATSVVIQVKFRRYSGTNGGSAGVAPAADNFTGTFNAVTKGVWTDPITISSTLFTSTGATLKLFPSSISDSTYAVFDDAEVLVTATKTV